jgi:heme-degrading monooxygenase HmoA
VFARVISAEVRAAEFDAVVSLARQQLPSVRQQAGFRGFYLLAGRETGQLITISLWETREAAHALEEDASQARAEAGTALELVTSRVQVLEVALHGSDGGPPPGPGEAPPGPGEAPPGPGGPPGSPYSIG